MGIVCAPEVGSRQAGLVTVGLRRGYARIIRAIRVINRKVVIGRRRKRERSWIEPHYAGSGLGWRNRTNGCVAKLDAWIGNATESDGRNGADRQAASRRRVDNHITDVSLGSSCESEIEHGGRAANREESRTGDEIKH